MAERAHRDLWRMVDGSWGAEVSRNGVGVGVRYVSLARALWHLLTVRRPDEWDLFEPARDAAASSKKQPSTTTDRKEPSDG